MKEERKHKITPPKSGVVAMIGINVILIIALSMLLAKLLKLENGLGNNAGMLFFIAVGMGFAILQIIRSIIQWRKTLK